MAAALIDRADEFDGEREEWPHYVERLKFLFKANGIDDAERQRAVFLSLVGPAPYKLLRKPDEKTFAELVKVPTKHYNPQQSETLQRYKF